MDVSPIAPGTSVSSKAASQLTSNFDTFLTLLTTQLKNQDPLEPMDSSEFTQQLVQFSSVEQQINANKNLETLIALTKARSSTDAVSYLGRNVTVTDGSGALVGGSARWSYDLSNAAANTGVVVTDSRGRLVFVGRGET